MRPYEFDNSPPRQRDSTPDSGFCQNMRDHSERVRRAGGCLDHDAHRAQVVNAGGCVDHSAFEAKLEVERTCIRNDERKRFEILLDKIREELISKGLLSEGDHIIASMRENGSASPSEDTPIPVLLDNLHRMWTAPDELTWHQYLGSNAKDAPARQTWAVLISRYFEGVFDRYWKSLEYSNRHGAQELRLAEPREIKLPPGMTFEGSRTLKTATGQAKALGFFEYVQLLEQYFREHNIPPDNFNRRAGCLLAGINISTVKNHVQTFINTSCYSMDSDKWSKLRRTLLEEFAPLQWRHALVSEWLSSLTQGNKPLSLYIANARHWSTIVALMLPKGQLPPALIAMILSAQSHSAVSTNLENFTWDAGSLPDTLAVLRLAEKRCGPDYNTAKAAKLDQGQAEPELAERPARTEQDAAVVKVMQTLRPQSNSAAVEILKMLQHLDQAQHAEPTWFSNQDDRPLPYPAQVVASINMIVSELKRMKWAGTLQDVHEKAGVPQEVFATRMRNRECTMCGSSDHFFHACPKAQPYQPAFTTAARAGGQQLDDPMRNRQQRHFESAERHLPAPQRGRGKEPPQERTPFQLARDTHIRSAGNQRFKREQWTNNGGAGQARRAEHNHQSEQLHHSHAYYQDADDYAAILSDDDACHSGSSDDFPSSPQQQGGPGNGKRV